jgi:hypothetical protein
MEHANIKRKIRFLDFQVDETLHLFNTLGKPVSAYFDFCKMLMVSKENRNDNILSTRTRNASIFSWLL